MQKAIALLLESNMPVLEIAKSVGYRSDGHFHLAFREAYGTTPAGLRGAVQGVEASEGNAFAREGLG